MRGRDGIEAEKEREKGERGGGGRQTGRERREGQRVDLAESVADESTL